MAGEAWKAVRSRSAAQAAEIADERARRKQPPRTRMTLADWLLSVRHSRRPSVRPQRTPAAGRSTRHPIGEPAPFGQQLPHRSPPDLPSHAESHPSPRPRHNLPFPSAPPARPIGSRRPRPARPSLHHSDILPCTSRARRSPVCSRPHELVRRMFASRAHCGWATSDVSVWAHATALRYPLRVPRPIWNVNHLHQPIPWHNVRAIS